MHTAARTLPTTNHFNSIPLGTRVLTDPKTFLSGLVPANVHEMIYDNDQYYTVVGLWPNGEKILGFKSIWTYLVEKYGDWLLPLYYVVENGVLSNYLVVHFRKEKNLGTEVQGSDKVSEATLRSWFRN